MELNDEEEMLSDFEEELPSLLKKKTKKTKGRKAAWSETLFNDLVDIIVSDEYFRQRLILTNKRNQKNGLIYSKVLEELTTRAKARGENVPFSAVQLRTKFKKAIGECKKAALTIRSGSGIKRFQSEKGYGHWFDQLFALVKTRDSCQPEQAIEPSTAATTESSSPDLSPPISGEESMFTPIRIPKKSGRKEDPIKEVVGMVKELVQQDPMKDFLEFAREEARLAREHEMRLMQMLLGMQSQPQAQQQNFQVPSRGVSSNGGYFGNLLETEEQYQTTEHGQRYYQF